MINPQELGIDASTFVGKLGVKIEVPRTLESGQRKEEKEITALGFSIAYVLPSLANMYTEESRKALMSNNIYPRFDHPEVIAKTNELLKAVSLPNHKSNPEQADLFVGGALHGLIKAYTDSDYEYHDIDPNIKPLTIMAAGALGLVAVNHIGSLISNDVVVRAKETIRNNYTARNVYGIYLTTAQSHAAILSEYIGSVIKSKPTDLVPSQLLPSDLSLSDIPSR